jgi:hypothetical protein
MIDSQTQAKLEADKDAMRDAKEAIDRVQGEYAPYEKFHPLAYCALAGTIGAQSVLMSKAVMTLLATTARGDNQFSNGFTYLFLACTVATVGMETHFLATALKYFDALYVVRVFQCLMCFNVFDVFDVFDVLVVFDVFDVLDVFQF